MGGGEGTPLCWRPCKGAKVQKWEGGLVGWEEKRGSGKVQRCKGGKVEISGRVDRWASGLVTF